MSHLSSNPLISVVIPTYNRANLIQLSVQSVLSQTYSNLEVIIVDDCSSDQTAEVVSAIDDPRITYLRQSSNYGGAVARNTGIKAAQGEYIAFLDSDDAWQPNKLELQLKHLLSLSYPDRTVSYTQVFNSPFGISESARDRLDEMICMPARGKQEDELLSDYLFCNSGLLQTSTLLLSRDLMLSTLFREDLRKHQDWDVCLRLEAQGAIFSFLAEPLVIWNGDPAFEHVGQLGDYRVSESWLNEFRTYISHKAFTAFYVKKILPSLIQSRDRQLFVQKVLLDALKHKLLSPKAFFKKSVRIWL